MAAAAAAASYEDFDPQIEWVRGDRSDTLLIHLPGFKKEQLTVQIDHHGNLRTSGERPLDGQRRIRFWKDFQMPKNCSVDDVRAKFESDALYVLFPKLITVDGTTKQPPAPPKTVAGPQPGGGGESEKANGKTAESVGASEDPKKGKKEDKLQSKEEIAGKQKFEDDKSSDQKKSDGADRSSEDAARLAAGVTELSRTRKTSLLNVVVATVVLLGLGLYVKYQLTKTEAS